MKRTLRTATVAALIAGFSTVALAQEAPVTVKAVGTWGNLTNYKKHEGPSGTKRSAKRPVARSSAISSHRPNWV
jgi:hypothetical protein